MWFEEHGLLLQYSKMAVMCENHANSHSVSLLNIHKEKASHLSIRTTFFSFF